MSRRFLQGVLLLASLSILVLGTVWCVTDYIQFKDDSAALQERYLQTQKRIARTEVENAVDFIRQIRVNARARLKTALRNHVESIRLMAGQLYETLSKTLPEDEVKARIIEAFRASRYNQGKGYYFILDADGRILLNPMHPNLEGQQTIDLRDEDGRFVIREMISIVTQRQTGFYEYVWARPDTDTPGRKLSYIRDFSPFGWVIGTGEYIEDMEADIQRQALSILASRRFGDYGYIFAGQWDGTVLLGPSTGENMIHLVDVNGVQIVRELIATAKSGGGFVEYVMPAADDLPASQKISYAKGVPEWQWFVGAGVFTDDIDALVIQKKEELAARMVFNATVIGGLLALVTLLGLVLSRRHTASIRRDVASFTNFFNDAAEHLTHVDPNRLIFQDFHEIAVAANGMLDARLRTITELQRSEQRFTMLMEQSPFAIEIYDSNGVLLRANRAWAALWDVDEPEEAPGNYSILTDPTARELGLAEALRRALAGETVFMPSIEFTPEKDGRKQRPRHILSRAYPLRDKDNSIEFAAITHEDISDRREVEMDRDRIFDTSQDLLSVSDLSGKLLRVNPAWTSTLGWDEHELKTFAPFDYVHPEDRDRTRALADDLKGTNRIYGFESRYLCKDGSTRWMSSNAYVDEDSQRLYAVTRDITDRKQAEDALLRTQFAVDNAAVAITWLTTQGRISYVNDAACALYGKTRPELTDCLITDLSPSLTTSGWKSFVAGLVDKGADSFQDTLRRADGTLLSIDTTAHLLELEGEKLVCLFTFDTTERMRTQQEMSRLRALLVSIVDSMPSLLIGVDADLRVTQWNSTAAQRTGIAAQDAIGSPLSTVLPLGDKETATVKEALASAHPQELLRLERYYDGHRVFEDMMVYPLAAHDVPGAVIRLDDVTERTRMENMMVQTEKMLSIGGLAAGLAHEINNPLGGILQGVQNIERRLSPDIPANAVAAEKTASSLDSVRAYLEERSIFRMLSGIRTAGERAASIVASMLEFNSRHGTSRREVDLAPLIDDAVELAATDYDSSRGFDFMNISIRREYPPQTPHAICAPAEMQQVLLSILRNAAQALHDDPETPHPTITLRLSETDECAVIEITDNGPGLPEGTQSRIFEPFYTTRDPGQGTGLSMSVAYYIVTQNHGGEIEVDSVPGEGTRFIIRLPHNHAASGQSEADL